MKATKNDVTLDFTPKEITKGTSKGKSFFGIDVTEANFGDISTFFGSEFIIGKINQAIRGLCINAYNNATDNNGNVDPDKVIAGILDARTTSASLSELREEQASLIAEFTGLNFSDPANMPRMQEIQVRLQELNVLMEARKRAPRVKEDDEDEGESKQQEAGK